MKLELQTSKDENIKTLLRNICKLYRMNIKGSIADQVESFSTYPTLDSLCIALDILGLKNLSVQITIDQLLEAPLPCVLHIDKLQGEFVILNNIEDDKIFKIFDQEIGWRILDKKELIKIWSGVTVLLENDDKNKNKPIVKLITSFLKKNIKLIAICYSLIIIFSSIIIASHSSSHFYPMIFYMIGLICSILLVREDLLDEKLKSVCNVSENFDCKSVLRSKGANVFNLIKLSDIGVLYFTTNIFAWTTYLLNDGISTNLIYFQLVSFLSLMFIPFSIIYQWKVLKKWCVLCLTVQGTLFLIAFSLIFYSIEMTNINKFPSEILLAILISPIFLFAIKTIFNKQITLEKSEWKLNKFRYDSDLFKVILANYPKINPSLVPKCVENGKKDSVVHFLIVTDPFCDACAMAHEQIKKLKDLSTSDFLVKTIFYTTKSKQPVDADILARTILSLPDHLQSEALEKWFVLKDLKLLQKHYRNKVEADLHCKVLVHEHDKWCHENDITYTPAIFFNYNRVDSRYDLLDLNFHQIASRREVIM